jgi:hypothetical protein
MHSDYVTLDQAEQRIDTVRTLLEQARFLKRELETIAARCNYDAVLIEEHKDEIKTRLLRLNDYLDELEMQGCYVKDLDIGLVDFLSTFEGRDIFLCWKLGEGRICHWHEVDEGYSSRQKILDIGELAPIEFETPTVENEN